MDGKRVLDLVRGMDREFRGMKGKVLEIVVDDKAKELLLKYMKSMERTENTVRRQEEKELGIEAGETATWVCGVRVWGQTEKAAYISGKSEKAPVCVQCLADKTPAGIYEGDIVGPVTLCERHRKHWVIFSAGGDDAARYERLRFEEQERQR